MSLAAEATEHPDAATDGEAIANTGSLPHVHALGELSGVLDLFFDGPREPFYIGATASVVDVFFERAAAGEFRVFSRAFWGTSRDGVFAVIYLLGTRPVLMAVVAIGHASPPLGLDFSEAETEALAHAAKRSVDL